jgi:hypothetical protein
LILIKLSIPHPLLRKHLGLIEKNMNCVFVTYNQSSQTKLSNIIKLETIHSLNSSIDEKLFQLQTLNNQHGGRFTKIVNDMIGYYIEINQLALAKGPKTAIIVSNATRINELT